MELIKNEHEKSKLFAFNTITHRQRELVVISQRNVTIAESMIRNDSGFYKMANVNMQPAPGFEDKPHLYQGSSAFWFTKLKELKDGKENKYSVEQIIKYAVNAVDRENSTHLNSDGVGREQIKKRIVDVYKTGRLFELLKNPGEKYYLFHKIAEETEPEDENKSKRTNYSFASKFCHYASFYLFDGEKEQDNYSIWDSVIRKSLKFYFDLYNLKVSDYNFDEYESYQDAIIKVITCSQEKVSRNGFDHLIWLYYRGRLSLDEYK